MTPVARIIPAYAGSTAPRVDLHAVSQDHPRIRGEHRRRRGFSPRGAGSSPHTRGALPDVFPLAGDIGIIPAYAGSTRASTWMIVSLEDHPRIRGEHAAQWIAKLAGAGSSPHTRGAPVQVLERVEQRRIIPAYAGSTWL